MPPSIWPSRSDHVQNTGGAKRHVDLDLGHLCAEAVNGIRRALTVPVQCRCGRVIGFVCHQRVPVDVGRTKIDGLQRPALACHQRPALQLQRGGVREIRLPQDRRAQCPPRRLGRAPGNEGLARG